MANYVKKVVINALNGKFNQSLSLSSNLNIIAGANGSGKTELLKFIQNQKNNPALIEFETPGQNINIASFSPKRNAQKVLMEQAQQMVRQDINAEQNALNAFINQQMQDNSFQTIKSISEYLALSAEKVVDQGNKTREEATATINAEYQSVLNKVFDYNINFSWNATTKKYISDISKNGDTLQFDQLSSGENAVISLVFAIFYSKDNTEIYLIDEPEVHLNWQLEEKLFSFFDWFSKTFNRQLIIVTHSRVCFIRPFSDYTKFFVWENGNILIKNKPDSVLQAALSGDIVKIVSGITSEEKIVYVEDLKQKKVIEKIAQLLSKSVEITELGNCGTVKIQAKAFKQIRIENVSFLIDGDNKMLDVIERKNYHNSLVQLKKYCVESYFFDFNILSIIDRNNPKKDIATELFASIKEVQQQNFIPIKALLVNKESLTPEVIDRLDASVFFKKIANKLGFSDEWDFLNVYIEEVNRQGRLLEIFPEISSDILSINS